MRIRYGRVSARDQHPEAQRDALGAAGCDEIFIDKASGKLASRPELDKALLVARDGDQLAVTELDRLGRSLEHLIQLSNQLQGRSVDLVVLDQGIDTSTPVGTMFFHILGAIAEFEHALMSERTRGEMCWTPLASASAGENRSWMSVRVRCQEVRVLVLEPDDRIPRPLRRHDLLARGEEVGMRVLPAQDVLGVGGLRDDQGVLRHCTDASIDRQYTDTHGQNLVGFAFAHLLGFKLLPRMENQETSMLALHLLQSALVFVNTLLVQSILKEPEWAGKLTDADKRGLSPLFWSHANLYGTIEIDIDTHLDLGLAA